MITRLRHETRRRLLTVETLEYLTPRMLRVGFTSPDLHDFVSASPDDHIKLFFPSADADSDPRANMRDFTPRRFDTENGRILIDFALHEAGPAMRWATAAKVGDALDIGGPRGSAVVPDDFDWYLLIGDETALPAMGRWVEGLRSGVPVTTVGLIANADETQMFETAASWTGLWAFRGVDGDEVAALRQVLDGHELPAGEGFVWIAAESGVARAMRAYMVEERGHAREWIKAAGYWQQGKADAHERIED